MPAQRLTKDQRRDAAREAARLAREKQRKRDARNRILARGGVVLGILGVLAIIAIVIVGNIRPPVPGPGNMASDGITFTGSDGSLSAVATGGTPAGETPTPVDQDALNRKIHIVTYIDYLCPFCKQFETTNAEQIRKLVEDGTASLEVHPIAILDNRSQGTRYSTRAANVAACIADLRPGLFLDVSDALFAQQPAENTEGLTDAQLLSLLGNVGINTPELRSCVNDETYSDWVAQATLRARTGPLPNTSVEAVTGTPTVLVNGVQYTGALDDPKAFSDFVNAQLAAVDDGDGTDG